MGTTSNTTPERAEELKRMKKARGLHFTLAGAQRAMDAKAAKWGYPPGYYRVTAKTGKRYHVMGAPMGRTPSQDYLVEVVLFGGRRRASFPVQFILTQDRVQYLAPLPADMDLEVRA